MREVHRTASGHGEEAGGMRVAPNKVMWEKTELAKGLARDRQLKLSLNGPADGFKMGERAGKGFGIN